MSRGWQLLVERLRTAATNGSRVEESADEDGIGIEEVDVGAERLAEIGAGLRAAWFASGWRAHELDDVFGRMDRHAAVVEDSLQCRPRSHSLEAAEVAARAGDVTGLKGRGHG